MARKKSLRLAGKSPGHELHPGTGTPATGQEEPSLWQIPFVHLLLIWALGMAVYATSVSAPFVFDDYMYLVNNPAIRSFACFPDTRHVLEFSINPDVKNNVILRPAAYATFAVNYFLHGYDVFGYHLVNLLLHVGCGLLVYALCSLLLSAAGAGEQAGSRSAGLLPEMARYLPLAAGVLFVCHPIQTQAVTYIVQRFVPLATFFYLAAALLYGQFRQATVPLSRKVTYLLALTSAVLAMESKEIAFTLPVTLTLMEFIFFEGAIAARLARLAPFYLTMAIIPVKLMQLRAPATPERAAAIADSINLVNFAGVSSWDYLMTQFGVITRYLGLLILPTGQNLDHDYPLQQQFFSPEVLIPLALLLMTAATGLALLKRSRENRLCGIGAFGIFWFFITLAVESSIIPIDDLLVEHRLYLPSVGFFMAAAAGAIVIAGLLPGSHRSRSRGMTLLLVVTVAALSAATVTRNRIWNDEESLWKDAIRKSPEKSRPYWALGELLIRKALVVKDDNGLLGETILVREGGGKQVDEAIAAFREVVRREPHSLRSHLKLAGALILRHDFDEAQRYLESAARQFPDSYQTHLIRGELYEAQGNFVRAREEYREAVRREPQSHLAHQKLAAIYLRENNLQAGIRELEELMRIFPDESVREKLARLTSGSASRQSPPVR